MNLEYKLKKVLLLYGLLLFFILLRVWFLSVIDYEKMQTLSVLPRRKMIAIAPTRGLITDSHQKLLAGNQKQFDLAICYQDIKAIPAYEYIFEQGVRIKFPKRKTYISDLACFLESYCPLSKEEIEDFIYAKAALFQDTSLVLYKNIPEKSYHKLKILEKDWPGLKIHISQSRHYPKEKVGCHVIGYLGAIDPTTYKKALLEKRALKAYIDEREKGLTPILPQGYSSPFEVRARYLEICQKSYNLSDCVGMDGVEKSFDHKLRGGAGKKILETTRLGSIISELPGSYDKQKPSHVELSVDIDLQEAAEKLLAERESGDELFPKGGACVVIDMKTAKVLALASYPRFNPTDFVNKNLRAISKWTESDIYIKRLYEGLEDIEKEKFSQKDDFHITKQRLTYPLFLERLVSEKSQVREKLLKFPSVKEAYQVIDSFEKLHEKFGFMEPFSLIQELLGPSPKDEETQYLLERVIKYLKMNDPVLLLDLLRLQIDPKRIQKNALKALDTMSLPHYFEYSQDLALCFEHLEKATLSPFKTHVFDQWKQKNFKEFLKQKRKHESLKKTYARPYTDYLEEEQQKQFKQFLKHHKSYFLAFIAGKIAKLKPELSVFESPLNQLKTKSCFINFQKALDPLNLEECAALIHSFRPFIELDKPLWGSYPRLLNKKHHREKDLALAFYPKHKLGYLRSNAYRYVAPQGSIFKVAVAYQALKEKLQGKIKKLPLIHDTLSGESRNKKEQILGYDEHKQPIRRWHKGGLLPRSSHSGIGQVDVVAALEQSSNIYFSLLASDFIKDPLDLLDTAKNMGLGQKTGIDLPYEAKGQLPRDIQSNKTGLYAFAIGQHELLVTPLQTAQMMASLFQNGKIYKPQIVSHIYEKTQTAQDIFHRLDEDVYNEALSHLGCFFPLFTENLKHEETVTKAQVGPQVLNQYEMHPDILTPIKKGLDRVVWGEKGTARPLAIASMIGQKEMQNYLNLKHQMIGKTGTAEQSVIETLDQDAETRMLNHIWFSCISFEDSSQKDPELAICIYLKDGKLGGKEAAPIAAKIIEFYKKQKNTHL